MIVFLYFVGTLCHYFNALFGRCVTKIFLKEAKICQMEYEVMYLWW